MGPGLRNAALPARFSIASKLQVTFLTRNNLTQ